MAVEGKNAIGELLIGCWSYAATLFESPHWVESLWTWWCKNPNSYTIRDTSIASTYHTLGKRLPQSVAEKYAQEQLVSGLSEQWTQLLAALPTPWSKDFGDACLDALRKHILALDGQSYPTGHWQMALTTIVLALPFACFEAAQAPWEFPESTTWQIQQWKNQMKTFTASVRKRQQIMEEI